MAYTFSTTIMAHPAREHLWRPLVAQLSNWGADPSLVLDRGRGLWDTARRAWLTCNTEKTHHLVLQDDVVLCNRFLDAVEFIKNCIPPNNVISFCNDFGPDSDEAMKRNIRWIRTKAVRSAQALMIPSPLVPRWITWCDLNVREDYPHDDIRLEMYLIAERLYCWNTTPSLVQHRAGPSIRGRVNAENLPHQARYFVSDNDPLVFKWATDILHGTYLRRDKVSYLNSVHKKALKTTQELYVVSATPNKGGNSDDDKTSGE
jgi:hypothetical protein